MAVTLFVLLILTLFHLMYESALAPSLRIDIRYDLFKLRDKIRMLHYKHPDQISDELFNILDSSINSKLHLLNSYNLSLLIKIAKFYNENPQHEVRAQHINNLMNDCKNEEFKKVPNQITFLMSNAVAVNMGGWLIYLLPIALIALVIAKISNTVYSTCVSPIRKLTFVSEEKYVTQLEGNTGLAF